MHACTHRRIYARTNACTHARKYAHTHKHTHICTQTSFEFSLLAKVKLPPGTPLVAAITAQYGIIRTSHQRDLHIYKCKIMRITTNIYNYITNMLRFKNIKNDC